MKAFQSILGTISGISTFLAQSIWLWRRLQYLGAGTGAVVNQVEAEPAAATVRRTTDNDLPKFEE